MTTEELIKALREKPSRDNRKLLDEAADRIETLDIELKAMRGAANSYRDELIRTGETADEILKKLTRIDEELPLSYKRVANEAVKEFAEIIKANQRRMFNYIYSRDSFREIIDNLVKEFTEGKR